jgi:probable phosphoglycerate mutase
LRIERVLLIRHGQTDWNIEGRWQGCMPVPLNEIGRTQARALADYLRNRPIRAIYTSDLPRALETATFVGDVLGLQPIPDKRLREFSLGIFEGRRRDELISLYPEEWSAFRTEDMDYTVPNGESRRALQDRMWAAWQDITSNGHGPEVAIVTHGGSLKQLLVRLFGLTPEIQNLRFENTSVTTIEREGQGWQLAEMAVASHLDSLTELPVSGDVHTPPENQTL